MKQSQFDLDLRHGQAVEGALANLLLRATVEVKNDKTSRRTGNFCIEYQQYGPDGKSYVPSGIAVTTAMYWAFQYDEGCYLIMPTERVKEIARRFAKDKGNRKLTGDNGNWSVLVPISAFIPSMQLVKTPAK